MASIDIKVKTLWNGQVALRDKQVVDAQTDMMNINVFHKGQVMQIPFLELDRLRVSVSEHRYRDKYSKEGHFLYYYKWVPTIEQGAMQL